MVKRLYNILLSLVSKNCWIDRFRFRNLEIKIDNVTYRLINHNDSLEELTIVINKAYSIYSKDDIQFMGVNQDYNTTKKRTRNALCFVAIFDNKLIGTITFKPTYACKGSNWFNKPFVSKFNQLAVLPEYQTKGIGGKLINLVETIAQKTFAKELALDTSEKATELIAYYNRRGYRYIENIKWKKRNYQSVVLSKKL